MKERFDSIAAGAENSGLTAASGSCAPALSSCGMDSSAGGPHPAVQHLKVEKLIRDFDDINSYILVPDPENGTERLAHFSAGQYLSIHIQTPAAHITRPYSIASSPREAEEGRYMLSIQRCDGGISSNYIHANWKAGSRVEASAPAGEFTYEPHRDARTVVALIGGTSITPLMSMAKAVAGGDEDLDKLILIYGTESPERTLYLRELKALESSPKFELHMVYSGRESEGSDFGFINTDIIKKYAPAGQYSLFIAGPQAMRGFLAGELSKLHIPQRLIRNEVFGEVHDPALFADYKAAADAAGLSVIPAPAGCVPSSASFKITVRRAGETVALEAPARDSILSSLEKAKIDAPARCHSGSCGWCSSRLISGRVFIPEGHDCRSAADKRNGCIHPCVSYPLSDITIEINSFQN